MKEQEVIKKLEKENSQSQEDGIVYVDRRIYVLNNQKLKENILQENHDPANIVHLGQ